MTSATAPKTIDLGGQSVQREGIAGGAITPGMLVTVNSSGEVVVHGTAGQEGARGFAVEYDLAGRGIDDDYAQGDQVVYRTPAEGSRFYGILASGQNVSRGAALTSNGDGRLKAAGDTDFVEGYAAEAVDASGGAARIRVDVHKGRGIA